METEAAHQSSINSLTKWGSGASVESAEMCRRAEEGSNGKVALTVFAGWRVRTVLGRERHAILASLALGDDVRVRRMPIVRCRNAAEALGRTRRGSMYEPRESARLADACLCREETL